jgi:hypothetical protein
MMTIAMKPTPPQYPADMLPQPVACYSVEKLTAGYGGAPLVVMKLSNSTQQAIPFAGDQLDQAALTSFLGSDKYGRTVRLFNQMFALGDAVMPTLIGKPPRISPLLKIGASSALLFQGGTENGDVFGLDIPPSIQSFNLSAGDFTVMAVLRPTTSMLRNQQFANGLAEGTILSLDAGVPFQHAGATTIGSDTIIDMTPSGGLVPGMLLNSIAFPPTGVTILSISPGSGPDKAIVKVFGATALASYSNVTINSSNPIVRLSQQGDRSPGSFGMTDHAAVTYYPQEFSGVEIRPVVACWTGNRTNPNDVAGLKIWQNEIIRSSPLISFRNETILSGFIGKMAGASAGGQSRSGDFWLAALLIWNRCLTQAERTMRAASLYKRFSIDYTRSTRQAKSVTITGDSISIDYVTLGNYGWSKRLADKFPDNVRFMNYGVPGSQVIASLGNPDYGYTEGMFPLSVARQMSYSKSGKNALIIFGGGNDMTDFSDFNVTFDDPSDTATPFFNTVASVAAATGNILTVPVTAFPPDLSPGALAQDLTNVSAIPAGTVVTAVDPFAGLITLDHSVTGVAVGDVLRFVYHNLPIGGRVLFLTLPTDTMGNVLITGITTNKIYYVQSTPSTYQYTLAATPGGPKIAIGGNTLGIWSVRQYRKSASQIFGTPTTHGIQKVVADATAAGASKIYVFTVLPRVGLEYNFIREDLNALIMGGGAGGYQPINLDSDPTLANNDNPEGTIGPGYFDSGHLNEVGSQALADFFYPTLNAYLNS